MSQKNKNSGGNKKFVCIFDSSHIVQSQDKLVSHMRKCKAMQKSSYLCCKYNGLHWVKHDTIDQHEENCQDRNKTSSPVDDFTRMLPDEISQFSIPFQVDMSMVQSSNMQIKKNKKVEPSKNENGGMKKLKQIHEKPKKVEMWKEPSFQDYLKKKGYKQKSFIKSANHNESFIGNNHSFLL